MDGVTKIGITFSLCLLLSAFLYDNFGTGFDVMFMAGLGCYFIAKYTEQALDKYLPL